MAVNLTRVRLTVQGVTTYTFDRGDVVTVGNEGFTVSSVEVLPWPLKVGTEIRGVSPTPIPIGTVLRSANGVVMEKTPYGWMSPGSEHAVVENPNPKGPPEIFPLTVLYVPEDGPTPARPHAYVGRLDRACEVEGCGQPDRAPIHRYMP